MKTSADRTQKSRPSAGAFSQKQRSGPAFHFFDNRPEAIAQRKLKEMANNSSQVRQLKAVQEMADTGSQINRQAHVLPAVNDRPLTNTIQRYPKKMDDASAKALGSLYSTAHSGKEDDAFTAEELSEIKNGVYMLTKLFPEENSETGEKAMAANCIGWARNENSNVDPGSIYTWTREYTATAASAGDAKIILWGTKNGKADETKWNILHASVLLTHKEIAARSKEFDGFNEITAKALNDAGISDPCWTSVGGFGYGAIVHPRNWFEGGDFGTALKGMK